MVVASTDVVSRALRASAVDIHLHPSIHLYTFVKTLRYASDSRANQPVFMLTASGVSHTDPFTQGREQGNVVSPRPSVQQRDVRRGPRRLLVIQLRRFYAE